MLRAASRVARSAWPARQQLVRLSTAPPPSGAGRATTPTPTPDDRPDEETVKRLAVQAKQSEQMWNLLVPERNIDWRGVVGLVALIIGLHTYNSYNRGQRTVDSMPPGAKEKLPNGSWLMTDGSIRQIEHTPTKVKAQAKAEDSPLMLDKLVAAITPKS